MLDILAKKLDGALKRWKGRGLLTEENIADGLREVRVALLEADVHYKIVQSLLERVRARAVGREVLGSLNPGQQVVKVVWDELRRLMGEENASLQLSSTPPTVWMLVGLQGSGKTTTAAKLALLHRRDGRRVLLAAADLQRPAAVEQLSILGNEIDVPVVYPASHRRPLDVVNEAVERCRSQGFDLLIVDTAGRLHIDDVLMQELRRMREAASPSEVLLVADAMTGQDAVTVAERFHQEVGLTGAILTKAEGDARGGAILSIRAMTGAPIKFMGTGERLDAIEAFHPDRMASRVLGMGDVLTLVERAEAAWDQEQAETVQKKIKKNRFDLEDFKSQIGQIKKIGSFDRILEMLPGGSRLQQMATDRMADREMVRVEAMINSMTPQERKHPEIINGSRRKRIARGSGTSVQDINRLLKNFYQAKKMVKTLSSGGKRFSIGKQLFS